MAVVEQHLGMNFVAHILVLQNGRNIAMGLSGGRVYVNEVKKQFLPKSVT